MDFLIAKTIAKAVVGVILMSVSMYNMMKKKPVAGNIEKIKLHSFEFAGSFWLIIFLSGFLLFAVSMNAFDAGIDPVVPNRGQANTINISLLSTVYADSIPKYCRKGDNGWVWLGTGAYNKRKDWDAIIVKGDLPDDNGKIVNKLVLKTTIWRNLREYHFNNITGTWIGKIFGVKLPKLVCVLREGSNVEVKQVTSVGLSKIWSKVTVQ